jgi:sec-independent protein translocase protein TatA
MLRDLGGWHLLIILAIVILLFGSTKLPGLAKGIGQSLRIFRSEMKDTPEPSSAAMAGHAAPSRASAATPSNAPTSASHTEPPESAAA